MLEKTNSKIFTFLLGLSALAVATAAAIFSVTGLSMLYSGEMLYVAIAMGALEFSKIITASYLYRYWKDTGFGLKTYLILALFVLMLVTSGGIYGYLTNSYQGATIGLDKINSQTQVLDQRKENLVAERERLVSDIATLRSERKSTIENRNNEIAANNLAVDSNSVKYRAWRNKQVHIRYNDELTNIDNSVAKYTVDIDSTNVRLSKVNDEISDKKLEMIDTGVEVGPLVYMARIFNTTMDNVMKWFTLVIVFVFDPLAIALIIALNVVLAKNRKEIEYKVGVDVAKPGDYSVTGSIEDGTFDSGYVQQKLGEQLSSAKPVEKAFDDIKVRIDEKKKEEEFLKEIDDEIEEMEKEKEVPELIKPLHDLTEEIKEKPTKDIVVPIEQFELELDGDFAEVLNETTKKVGKDEPTKDRLGVKDSKEIAHANEFFDKMREEKPDEKSPVTEDEIREYFENAVRKVKKEGQGEITRTPFQSGGSVSVGHMEDDPDTTDYSIQE
jgi:hypothetical protein